jgi:hypothetical protein
MLEEAEMSQVVNGVTSSSKRPYRKGNPLSDADKQRSSVAKERATHKEVKSVPGTTAQRHIDENVS